MKTIASALLSVWAAGCAGSREEPPPPYVPPDREVAARAPRGDAPEISRSRGQAGGLVVFWPRVIPRASAAGLHDTARAIQDELRAIAERHASGRALDVRPEPERVCPRDGCDASTLGALVVESGGGCVVIGLVSGPGEAPTRLVPWVGGVQLRATTVPFREPPETQVRIDDFEPCGTVVQGLGAHEAALAAALQEEAH